MKPLKFSEGFSKQEQGKCFFETKKGFYKTEKGFFKTRKQRMQNEKNIELFQAKIAFVKMKKLLISER